MQMESRLDMDGGRVDEWCEVSRKIDGGVRRMDERG